MALRRPNLSRNAAASEEKTIGPGKLPKHPPFEEDAGQPVPGPVNPPVTEGNHPPFEEDAGQPVPGPVNPPVTEGSGKLPKHPPFEEHADQPVPGPVNPPVPASSSKVPARTTQSNLANVAARDESFEGLEEELGFGSFPLVKLDKTQFVCGERTFDALDEVVLLQGKKKYLYKATTADDTPLVYSYDKEHSVSGEPLSQIFDDWRAEGYTDQPIMLTYMELLCQIISAGDGSMDGEMVLLNIAPTSLKVLAGHQALCRAKGYRMNQVITRVCLGDKIKVSNASRTYYPWAFKFVRVLPNDYQL